MREVPKGTNPHYYEDFADAPLDVNGDGHMDIVTCAYFSKKIAWTVEPCMYIFGFDRVAGKWTRSTVHLGEPASTAPLNPEHQDALKDFRPGSAGTGLQMVIRDMDNDGDLDIVAPGKSGLYWFENLRLSPLADSKQPSFSNIVSACLTRPKKVTRSMTS